MCVHCLRSPTNKGKVTHNRPALRWSFLSTFSSAAPIARTSLFRREIARAPAVAVPAGGHLLFARAAAADWCDGPDELRQKAQDFTYLEAKLQGLQLH